MELQQEDIAESNQSAEPTLSSPQPPPTHPLHPMPIRALHLNVDAIDSDDLSITRDLENFPIRGLQPSSVTTGDVSSDPQPVQSLCSFHELKHFSDASQTAFSLPSGSSGLSAQGVASNIPVMLHELASSRAGMEHMETLREDLVTGFAEVTHQELNCSVCGKVSATWKDCAAHGCEGQAWCDGCNSRWHSSNPRRKEHQLTRIRRELICAICEREHARWKDCPATECKGKAWCEDCNTVWHSDHPKRREHQPTRVMESEAKSPRMDLSRMPVREVPVSHQDDLHLTSTQQSAATTFAPQLSPAASAAPAAVQSPSSPQVCLSLTHLAKLCDGPCYCVSRTLDGRLLVGGLGSLEIRATGGELLSSTRTKGTATGACELMGRFYWLIHNWSSDRRISVRDSRSLEEIYSWTLPDSWYTNLAVLGQSLVVPDPDNSQLLVYSSKGKLLSQHAVSGAPEHVSTSGTDVIVSDQINNTVSVYDTSSSAYRLKFSYTGLKHPTAATVGSDGYLYVVSLSEENNKLHVLSAAGQLIAELHHAGLSRCFGLNITGDQLLAATFSGLHLYQLGR